jgi:hypothetical protein
VVRPNTGFSYAAWNDAINQCVENREDFSHYMLMEDDYIPARSDFLDVFLSKMDDNVGFVCHKLSHEALSAIFTTQIHAGISNGLLLGQAAREAYETYGSALCMYKHNNAEYDWSSIQLQIHFLDFVTKSGYTITDPADISSAPFLHNFDAGTGANALLSKSNDLTYQTAKERGWFLMEWANPKAPRLLEPVIEWDMFSPIGAGK